jgi:predicted pyridoxine 5'-phosphate oxidase superfamily flavin-nucleotide-binding protein
VFTVDAQGSANVVSKGDVAVLDDEHIVFADLYSGQNKENIAHNPRIAIAVINPAECGGYHLRGTAEIVERGNEFDLLAHRVAGAGQLKDPRAMYAVKMKVENVCHL